HALPQTLIVWQRLSLLTSRRLFLRLQKNRLKGGFSTKGVFCCRKRYEVNRAMLKLKWNLSHVN
ncbi:hypothetical protein, partial [uncultured Flavonifractor sp.]|uniref:hypothetical protein n=1 Tax=uncultured Flavonifractor sp. TaxID=1193534 RepID=UPI00261BFF53